MFGKSVSLLDATAEFESNNDTESGRIAMQVSVKGESIYNFSARRYSILRTSAA